MFGRTAIIRDAETRCIFNKYILIVYCVVLYHYTAMRSNDVLQIYRGVCPHTLYLYMCTALYYIVPSFNGRRHTRDV